MPHLLRSVPMRTWAIAVGVFIWLAGIAVGAGRWTALLAGALTGVAVFLLVRLYWADWSRRP
jgi:hypothetical protein